MRPTHRQIQYIIILVILLTPSAQSQPLSQQPLSFTTHIKSMTQIKVKGDGSAEITVRLNMTASDEFNRALEAWMSELEDAERRSAIVRRAEAVLTLLGYEVEELDMTAEDGWVVCRMKIANFAVRLNDTWMIKPQVELQPVTVPLTTFTRYTVEQETLVLLPRGAEVLLVMPEPYEKKWDGAKVSLSTRVEQSYLTAVNFTYTADLPPGTELPAASQETFRIIYTYTPPPLSSPVYLLLSVILITASVACAYRVCTGR